MRFQSLRSRRIAFCRIHAHTHRRRHRQPSLGCGRRQSTKGKTRFVPSGILVSERHSSSASLPGISERTAATSESSRLLGQSQSESVSQSVSRSVSQSCPDRTYVFSECQMSDCQAKQHLLLHFFPYTVVSLLSSFVSRAVRVAGVLRVISIQDSPLRRSTYRSIGGRTRTAFLAFPGRIGERSRAGA